MTAKRALNKKIMLSELAFVIHIFGARRIHVLVSGWKKRLWNFMSGGDTFLKLAGPPSADLRRLNTVV
jgi:hypothetical protein